MLAPVASTQRAAAQQRTAPEADAAQSQERSPARRNRRTRQRPESQRGPNGSRSESFRTDVPSRAYDIVLGRPTDSSVTVSVLAYSDMQGRVEYGIHPGDYSSESEVVELRAGDPVELRLDRLEPNTAYFYRWRGRTDGSEDFESSDESRFHTRRLSGDGFVFTLQSDPHLDDRTEPSLYEASLANAAAAQPDFHIDLGDTFMVDKRRDDFRESLAQYLAQRYYFGLIGRSAPVFLVSGNHDGEGLSRGAMGEWAREQRRKYFATPSDDYPDWGNYYSWEWGDALFVALDPFWATQRRRGGNEQWGRTLGDEQYRWLRDTLEQSRARFKFVFIHHLVGGKDQAVRGGVASAHLFEWGGRDLDGTEQFDERRPGWGKPIHQLLADTGVTILFHGHDHMFAKEELDGVVYQLVPQPGLDRYGAPRSAREYGYVHGKVLGGPGILRVQVSGDETQVDLVRPYVEGGRGPNGETAYSYRVRPRCAGGC